MQLRQVFEQSTISVTARAVRDFLGRHGLRYGRGLGLAGALEEIGMNLCLDLTLNGQPHTTSDRHDPIVSDNSRTIIVPVCEVDNEGTLYALLINDLPIRHGAGDDDEWRVHAVAYGDRDAMATPEGDVEVLYALMCDEQFAYCAAS
jgi:hypothetical protein